MIDPYFVALLGVIFAMQTDTLRRVRRLEIKVY